MTFSIFACGLVIYITASRVTWAMARDERFPGWKAMRKVSPQVRDSAHRHRRRGRFSSRSCLRPSPTSTGSLFDLFSAATLMPAIIYFVTVCSMSRPGRKLPGGRGFNLGKWE